MLNTRMKNEGLPASHEGEGVEKSAHEKYKKIGKIINDPDDWMMVHNLRNYMSQTPPHTFAIIRHNEVREQGANSERESKYTFEEVKFLPESMRKEAEDLLGFDKETQEEYFASSWKGERPSDVFAWVWVDKKFTFTLRDSIVIT